MPGASKKDISITINDDFDGQGRQIYVIKIESEKKDDTIYSENHYSRSFYMPDNVNLDKIKAKSLNGILTKECFLFSKKSKQLLSNFNSSSLQAFLIISSCVSIRFVKHKTLFLNLRKNETNLDLFFPS